MFLCGKSSNAVRPLLQSDSDSNELVHPVTTQVPVGPGTLGRILNVIGEPIDEKGPVKAADNWSIHRPAPLLVDQGEAGTCPQHSLTDMLITTPEVGK